ncbi:uncharacterized protein LOC119595278 [Penaeus monodon]|uniref:uncharacterized protein LOC119595278 n=1 Tax=Penaeus monodon TaxID=6687 RepID=UPI0018A75468|nr:uncharacterized protein LOC119595278 [Penaeus monodon]
MSKLKDLRWARDHYRNIVGNNVVWLRYADDILTVVPIRTNLQDLLHRLNARLESAARNSWRKKCNMSLTPPLPSRLAQQPPTQGGKDQEEIIIPHLEALWKIMDTVKMQTMTCGADTWSPTKHQKEKLAVTQINMERSMLNRTRKGKIRNEVIRAKVKDIVSRVENANGQWADMLQE